MEIDIELIKEAGQQFTSKRLEIEALVFQKRKLMNYYSGSRIRAKWDTIQPDLDKAIVSLQAAGDLLNQFYMDLSEMEGKIS